ncbi:unnamed protein product [Cylicostephanus goldi]|uniref:Retrotransposon gag domain-containing protein n=1 Tax=Cylicostephanus goldi TaxID=71465 RepID=A0A3P6SCP6_CYLGO|nr:unnamed protein product [Cylicostephanus goldi]
MGPPHTRSRTQSSDSRAVAPISFEDLCEFSSKVTSTLVDVADDATIKGHQAKELRNATAQAISDAWKDSRSATAALAKQVNESNSSLLQGLNDSFSAVGQRIDGIPQVLPCMPEASLPRIPYFSGANGGDLTPFSVWLRRFEDIQNLRPAPLSQKLKAYHLIAYLEGAAREKVDELTEEQRQDYDTVVAHLRKYYEGPHLRNMARRALSIAKQELGESAAAFADRIFKLVRAATPDQDISMQQQRVLEEFTARLRPRTRFQVELNNPTTLQQALDVAQMVEQIAETTPLDHSYSSGEKYKQITQTRFR